MGGTDPGFFFFPFAYCIAGLFKKWHWAIAVSASSKRAIYCHKTLGESFRRSLELSFLILKMGLITQTSQGHISWHSLFSYRMETGSSHSPSCLPLVSLDLLPTV